MKHRIKNFAGVAMIVMLVSLGGSIASASEVTGTLSSSGVSSSGTGTTGTLSGTVSEPRSRFQQWGAEVEEAGVALSRARLQ